MNFVHLHNRFWELTQHPTFRSNPPVAVGRMMKWAMHCLFRRPAKAKFQTGQGDYTLFLPPKFAGGGSTCAFLFREQYEPEMHTLKHVLRPGGVFVDAGANTGAYTFAASRIVGPEGRVIAFEPGPRCFRGLQKSADLNDAANVILRDEAVSNTTGPQRIYLHGGQDNSYSLGAADDPNTPYEEIETITLDEALEEHGIDQVDLLKFDIEGAQEPALQGATRLLQRCKPVVFIHNSKAACERMGLDAFGAHKMLAEQGYRFYTIDYSTRFVPSRDYEPIRLIGFHESNLPEDY